MPYFVGEVGNDLCQIVQLGQHRGTLGLVQYCCRILLERSVQSVCILCLEENQKPRWCAGQVFLDGLSIGQENGYDEVFNFQTINSRPFYFFRHNDKVDAWFDGQVISLDYDNVPHYVCCADSWFNPKAFQGAVLFFGTKNNTWFFVRIGAPGVLP